MNRIAIIRKEQGLTQNELASLVGVSQPYIHDLEQGNRKLNEDISKRLADVLHVTVEELKESA